VPTDALVDGASIPQLFWSVIGGPFEGNYLKASIIHDYYCDTKTRTAHDTHRNFYYGMRANGVGVVRAKLMYWAVRTFGPDWILEKEVAFNPTCVSKYCSLATSITLKPIQFGGFDLGEPATAEVALQKFSAVAKNLETSNGAYFDVSTQGPVPADLEAIDLSASLVREAFSKNLHMTQPAALGVLDRTASIGQPLKVDVQWADGKLPTYEGEILSGASDAVLAGDSWAKPLADTLVAGDGGKWTLGGRPAYLDADSWTVIQDRTSKDAILYQQELQKFFKTSIEDFDRSTIDFNQLRNDLRRGAVPSGQVQ
jgi:hypothetical protein